MSYTVGRQKPTLIVLTVEGGKTFRIEQTSVNIEVIERSNSKHFLPNKSV